MAFFCKTVDVLPPTLTCTTPNRGYHYVFKLNDLQRKKLINLNSCQPGLFGYDIDVLYNKGRFVMSGKYKANCPFLGPYESHYKIVDPSKPAILPDLIFNEIVDKCLKSNDVKSSPKNPPAKKLSDTDVTSSNNTDKNTDKNMDKILKKYLKCLKPERCDKRESWLRVGAIIFNEGGTFELFDEWSQLSQKYEADACKKIWNSFDANRRKKITISALKNYAKEDDPVLYRKIRQKTKLKKPLDSDIVKAKPILDEIYIGKVNDKIIADLIYCLYPDKFIYDKKSKYWYTLNKYNIYEEEDRNLFTARELINTHILSIIKDDANDRKDNCKQEIAETKDKIKSCKNNKDPELEKINSVLKNLYKKLESINNSSRKLIQFLCTETRKDNVVRALATLCRKRDIYEKLETVNPYLFAFKNGVYDLKNNTFRLPTPEEYISCTCKYKYETPKQKYVDKVENIFSQVFTDPLERRYVLMILATSLIGTNVFENFIFLMGNGSNGKGLIMQLLDSTLGGYFGTLDIDYFNSKDIVKSHAANSSLAACKNSRWVNVCGVDSNIKLKENRLKQLSGRDKILARNLYGNAFEYIAKFKLCFQTNEKPIIDGADDAIKRRLRYITFRTKFVDNPVQPNERKIDRDLKDRILLDDQYKFAFFTILLKYYYILADSENMELKVPQTFQIEIDNYLHENDPVNSFVKDCLTRTNNPTDRIQSSDLYNEFKFYSNDKFIHISKFKTILEKNGLKSVRGRSGSVYHNLIFKSRPSQNNKNNDIDIEFIDD